MLVAGLFAGIGGIEAGFKQAGHDASVLCEILPGAGAVLRSRFQDVEIKEDVRAISDLSEEVDVVTAGFPCQDLSQAGRGLGLSGEQSSLVGEVFRLVRKRTPEWVVLENVPFMLQLGGGSAMLTIVSALEELGYRWAWRVVDSFGFGLPQRRERVFIVASRTGNPADVLLADENPFERPRTELGQRAHGFYWTEGVRGLGWAADAVPTLKNGSTIGIPSPPAILMPDGKLIKPDIRDAERLQGFDENWTRPAERVDRASRRWALVGSAVSVPVARWLGARLAEPGVFEPDHDDDFNSIARLPRAARFDGRKRYRVEVSSDPIGRQAPPLTDFLKFDGTPLSIRATRGFLDRTKRAKLRFADGFLESVEAHLDRMIALESASGHPEKRVA